jgi:hypothetical protein
MGAFKPALHENILFPVPFAENEQHPLIITNKRVVQRSEAGAVEVPTDDLLSVGRQTMRPQLPLGVILLIFALPLVIFGAYQIYSVWGMTAADPLSLFSSSSEDETAAEAPPPDSAEGAESADSAPRTVLLTRGAGALCLLLALGFALGARKLINRKKFYVVARGNRRLLKMEVKDEIQQTQVMVTISAVKGKAKA